jgi:ATP-binding cassette, subfamily B, bacterial PglK
MNIFSSFKLVFNLLENKKIIPFLIILFLFNSVIEVIGISAIAWFLVLATNPLKSNSEIYLFIVNWSGISDTTLVMPIIGLMLLCLIIMKSGISILTNRFIYQYSFNQGALLRKRLLERYLNLSYEDWVSRPMAEYIQSVLNLPVQYSQNILLSVVRIFSEGVVFIGISIFIILIDSFAFFMFALIMITLYWSYNLIFRKKSLIYGKKINDESREMISTITESLTGFAEIKLKNVEDFFLKRLMRSAKEFSLTSSKFEIINTIPRYLIEISILFFIVLYLISFSFYTQQPIESLLYTLGVLGAASIRIAPSANLILSAINQIRFGRDTLQILKDVLIMSDNSLNNGVCDVDQNSQIESIEIQSVSFAYAVDESKPVIRDISLKITPGKIIGIKGKTGSGKSTLLALILGLLKPSSGSIKYNYKAESFFSTDCIQPASYIPQKPFIINDSILKNVAIGEQVSNIDKDKVLKALRMAQLNKEISYDKPEKLGEAGNNLSGGQRQRLIIARAFYEENKIIILDEPTSALDSFTRDYIIQEIQLLKKRAIIIIVSHDKNLLDSCDEVYEINDGKLINNNT